MKRYLITLITIVLVFGLVGCHTETVPEEKNLEVLNTLDGSTLEKTHEIEDLKFITTKNIFSFLDNIKILYNYYIYFPYGIL